jgi:hypothetical protein
MPGKWHNKMEELFPQEMSEVKFYCSSSVSNTCRRADILLSDNRTCEIQHSYISENEIVNRFNDWNKFGKEIIWLVDGNEGVQLEQLSTGNYLLIFNTYWKYKSFMKTYDFILLEKDNQIFKIELNKIKSGMIELKEPKSLQHTITLLKTKPTDIWNFWSDENTVKSVLGVYQQGAGNGKTYGIWKSITENQDRKTYIIVTKQHSAKTVIYEELLDQKLRFQNSEGKDSYHIEYMEKDSESNTEKHYVIKYTHKQSKRECTVIIGTIDSFCYNLSHSNAKGADFFKGIVDNIKENGATKINNGYMRFGGQNIQLSKESEIWIDEVQDLPENYLHAMIKLMYETQCYMNVVGDKLQSLEFPDNFLTQMVKEGLPNIALDVKHPININRRIKVTNMGEKINELIDFAKCDLPEIECDEDIEKTINDDPIKIIESPAIYANDTNNEKVNNFCDDEIMKRYINEVETHNYSPNDFLIIFPIMKANVIAPELQTKIQEYWTLKYDSKYIQYVYLHKHTEGTVINTNDSINATRIMSIRSSKGDGRNVVFVLGVTEQSLKIVSNKEKALVYESHLHVALTRAKKQVYFGLIKNNDNIHQRFGQTGYVEYLPDINKKVGLEKMNELINKDTLIELLQEKKVSFENIIKDESKIEQSETVDWGYHCIKYQTFYYQVILNIVNDKDINSRSDNSQLFVKLRIISDYLICDYNVKDFYKFLNKHQFKTGEKVMKVFPLCKLSDKPEYKKYCDIIEKAMKVVKQRIKNNTLDKLNVYESIILTYMIQIETSQKYAEMSPMDIYNITDYFQTNTNKETELLNNIKNVKSIIGKSCIKDYKNINWNVFKHIEMESIKDYFKINKLQFPIIGNNKTDIIHIVLKSDISHLNFWDIMIEILLERFLIYNPKSQDDKNKYKDKKINTYLFLLDKNTYIKIEWDWDKALINEIKSELKVVLKEYFESNHDDIYKYFTHIRTNKEEVWSKEPHKIIDEIIQKCNGMRDCPDYIIDVFDDIIYDKDYDGVIKNNYLNILLNKKLERFLKRFFTPK